MLWLLILKAKNLPAEVAFWYTLPIDQRLAPSTYLWIVPAIALACCIINLSLSWWLYRKYPAAARLLATIAAVVCLLAVITTIKTILIYSSLL